MSNQGSLQKEISRRSISTNTNSALVKSFFVPVSYQTLSRNLNLGFLEISIGSIRWVIKNWILSVNQRLWTKRNYFRLPLLFLLSFKFKSIWKKLQDQLKPPTYKRSLDPPPHHTHTHSLLMSEVYVWNLKVNKIDSVLA